MPRLIKVCNASVKGGDFPSFQVITVDPYKVQESGER